MNIKRLISLTLSVVIYELTFLRKSLKNDLNKPFF